MVPEVLALDLVLRDPALRSQLGRDHREQPGLLQESEADGRAWRAKKLLELGGDAFPRKMRGQVGPLPDRRQGGRLDREVQHGGEPDRSNHSECVLVESGRRITDGPKDSRPDIRTPTEGIDQLEFGWRSPAPSAPGHGIDGEIPPREVGLERIAELDPMRPPVVRVVVVAPVGRDRVILAVAPNEDRPESVLVDGTREQRLEPFGSSLGREIPVPGLPFQQPIPQRAADDESVVVMAPQRLEDLASGRREVAKPCQWHRFGRDGRTAGRAGRIGTRARVLPRPPARGVDRRAVQFLPRNR